MGNLEAVEKHFRKQLGKGMGDLEAMLSGIRYRLESGGKLLDPNKRPPGYRSEKLRDYLRKRGAKRTSLWGATAIRGDLDPKAKGHIIEFFRLVNKLSSDSKTLTKALEVCADLYVGKINAKTPEAVVALRSDAQTSIANLLNLHGSRATAGKAPQGLVYSLLRLRYLTPSDEFSVMTKKTHAGDAQSGLLGDIRVTKGGNVHAVFEVKGLVIDRTSIERILPAHGKHDYPLFILGLGFEPSSLKEELNGMDNTFAINLVDYFLTIFSEIAISEGMTVRQILSRLVKIYNEDFCEKIEQDSTIRIKADF